MTTLVHLTHGDDFGVYSADGRRGPFDTPLLFRGTLAACIAWRRADVR